MATGTSLPKGVKPVNRDKKASYPTGTILWFENPKTRTMMFGALVGGGQTAKIWEASQHQFVAWKVDWFHGIKGYTDDRVPVDIYRGSAAPTDLGMVWFKSYKPGVEAFADWVKKQLKVGTEVSVSYRTHEGTIGYRAAVVTLGDSTVVVAHNGKKETRPYTAITQLWGGKVKAPAASAKPTKPEPSKPVAQAKPTPASKSKFKKGQKVKAKYPDGEWYKGKLGKPSLRKGKPGFMVIWADGDDPLWVAETNIRPDVSKAELKKMLNDWHKEGRKGRNKS